MVLNNFGEMVEEFWIKIESLHENIELDNYVIMPNHIHGIIIINVGDENLSSPKIQIENSTLTSKGNARFAFPTDRTKMELSKLIQQFKRAVTLKIKTVNQYSNFKWQRSFYDRIIRNEKELFNIRKYIRQNPLKLDLENDIDNLELK